jgi:hypothetical protein
MDSEDSLIIKTKRGRKPKNRDINEQIENNLIQHTEKKKRGRKKKYEIENFNRIVNRDLPNNFNHKIAYSDDEEYEQIKDLSIRNNTNTPNTSNTSNTPNTSNTSNTPNTSNNIPQILPCIPGSTGSTGNTGNTGNTGSTGNTGNKQVKNISFGNLNIVVSKKITGTQNIHGNIPNYGNSGNNIVKKIIENEYSDEDVAVPMEEIINDSNNQKFEKYYKDNKKYITNFTENNKKPQKTKRLRVITTLKNIIKNNNWPDKTDVCCWWCCHRFDNSPCTLPIKYNDLKKSYDFIGIFCSWNCTKAYNNYKNDYKKYERGQLITLLVKQIYGIENSICIKTAPYRECLKMFGGYMNIEEFRNSFLYVDSYSLNLLNFRYIYPEITEITNIDMKKNTNNLRLARSKNN